MPYLITTTTPCGECGTQMECHGPAVSRRAVATLDEAIATGCSTLSERTGHPEVALPHARALHVLPEPGGTIGPLPDGTTITVEVCDRFWLLGQMGADEHDPRTTGEIVAAFNDAQGQRR